MEYDSDFKKKAIQSFLTMWVNIKDIMLGQTYQT